MNKTTNRNTQNPRLNVETSQNKFQCNINSRWEVTFQPMGGKLWVNTQT